MFPTGRIVRSMRLRETETDDNGNTTTRMVSGAGIVVHIRPDVPETHAHLSPADMRRAFRRFCASVGVIPTECENAHGKFSQLGKPIASGIVSAFQCIGTAETLSAVASHFAVAEWHPAISARVPFAAIGNGPDKVRPSTHKPTHKPTQHDESVVQRHRDSLAQLRERGQSY